MMSNRKLGLLAALFWSLTTIISLPALNYASLPPQTAGDKGLSAVRRSDAAARDASGKLSQLSLAEHMRRASIYMANRAFAEAREHWQALIEYYPQHPRVPEALLGIGRSYFQSRGYEDAFSVFDHLASNFGSTKEGREGLNYSAAALLRLGRFNEAVDRYSDYVTRYPNGERIETAYLNVIDTLREAGRPREALVWIAKTRQRFAGTPTETNAVFAQLRLHIAEGHWRDAIATAEQLRGMNFQKGVATSAGEVAYLKAFSLEQAGRKDEAFSVYASVPDGINAYYGWLATQRMLALAEVDTGHKPIINERVLEVNSQIASAQAEYPAPYRQSILRIAKSRKLDPRFVLALIKQESVFRPTAKSPAGARGLLQLTMDAAQRYASGAGLTSLQEAQLYQPEASIRLGVEYLAQLTRMFPQMFEAVAASYNGGEDNVARWVKRAQHKDGGVFTSEVGFEETKGYVQKVMANYRVYRQLYTSELVKK
jgi:soluble lytic murein transglycosylase